MHIAFASIAAAVVAAAAVVMTAPAAPTLKITHCSQIKNGPYAAYTSALGHKLRGRTWTVAVRNSVPACSVATKLAPAVLTWWAKAKIGDGTVLQGFACSKDKDRAYSGSGYSSGGAACLKGNGYFSVSMTGPYTLEQLKKLFGG